MKRDQSLKPKQIKKLGGTAKAAWWYGNDESIDVVIETPTSTGIARISRRSLIAWITRTAKLR